MLSYILMFSLVALIMLGVIRASKNHRLHYRAPKEPFLGAGQASEKFGDSDENVGKPRVIGHHPESSATKSQSLQNPTQKHRDRGISTADKSSTATKPPLENAPAAITEERSTNQETDDKNEVIVITLIADEAHPYSGYKLLQSLLAAGLRYGKWEIFHYHQEKNGHGPILFSLASISNPGTFDLAKMRAFSTPGLALFIRLSKLSAPATALDIFLRTTNQLVSELGGTICDEKRIPLTEQKIAYWHSIVTETNIPQQTDRI